MQCTVENIWCWSKKTVRYFKHSFLIGATRTFAPDRALRQWRGGAKRVAQMPSSYQNILVIVV